MAPRKVFTLAVLGQFLQRILPRGLEQVVSRIASRELGAHERLRDERREHVEHVFLRQRRVRANDARTFQREAAGKYGETLEQEAPLR